MSKLVEALKTATNSQTPMGFKSVQKVAAKPKLLIIASTDIASSKLAENLKGASALIITSEVKSSQIKAITEVASGIPWGCSLDSQTEDGLEQIIKEGADFMTFSTDSPLKALSGYKAGKLLEVSNEAAEKLPRAINDSPVDAVCLVAAQGKEPLTWQHLLLVKALSSWLNKPLLVSVPDGVNDRELQYLWDAGAAAIVTSTTTSNIARLRKLIDGLEYPARHLGGEAVLPFTGLGQAPPEAEEDEDW